jgi:predicted RNA-binding protein
LAILASQPENIEDHEDHCNLVRMSSFWIIPTNSEAWELVKEHNIYAFHRESDRDKINPGDKAIFYITRSNPPVFVGVFEFQDRWEEATEPFWPNEKVENRIIHPWRFRLTPLRMGAADARKLSRELSFIEHKENWQVYFQGSLANFQHTIPENDYRLILEQLGKPPIAYEIKPRAKPLQIKEKARRKKVPELRGPVPAHNEIRDMIYEIGLMKGVLSEVEYPINDMRLDVAWRLAVRQNPDHAWEVQIGGNFFEALAKLKHAWDLWKADPYLVTTEHFEEETRKLLGGTFHEIKPHIRVVNWKEIVKLYKLLRDATLIEKEMKL